MNTSDIPNLVKIGSSFLFSKKMYYPVVASFDVTTKCTLHCKHCYWWEEEHFTDIDDNLYYEKVLSIKKTHPTLVSASWIGGEPLLRKKLIERCKKLFSFNRIITNGTIELPNWSDISFIISLDGTKKYHELQRGNNTYERIKKNIILSKLNITLYFVITKLNYKCIDDFVAEWSTTSVKSVGFGFYTPIKGKNNDELWLNFDERDKVIDRILHLKKKYGNFINSSEQLLNGFKSKTCQKLTTQCRQDYAPFNAMCFNSQLKRKFPCVIGENADCERCGCIHSVNSEIIKNGDFSIIRQFI
jgi:sulfatase maturation enzyme AslB (radical SAM superfamily)